MTGGADGLLISPGTRKHTAAGGSETGDDGSSERHERVQRFEWRKRRNEFQWVQRLEWRKRGASNAAPVAPPPTPQPPMPDATAPITAPAEPMWPDAQPGTLEATPVAEVVVMEAVADDGSAVEVVAAVVPDTFALDQFPSTMMDFELTLQHVLGRAALLFPNKEIVTNTANGPQRTTYGAWAKRVSQLGGALSQLGVQQGDRVATLGWNTASHLECYFAIPCYGAVLHTLNLRLSPQDLAYIINDAQDSIIFADSDLVPLLERVSDQLTTVRAIVVMNGTPQVSDPSKLPPMYDYEELLAAQPAEFAWPQLDEKQAAAMCYTSGTTGNPKGVVYTHRSIILHSMAGGLPDVLNVSERDVVFPFVPMFHANAWGLAHSAPMFGAKLVFPGRLMDPANCAKIMADEKVTLAAAVPTVWVPRCNCWTRIPAPTTSRTCSASSAAARPFRWR